MILSSFLLSLNSILTLLVMIAAGYAAKRVFHFQSGEVKRFNLLVFHVFLPLMLFGNLYQADLRSSVNVPLILYAVGTILMLTAVTWAVVVKLEPQNAKRGVMIQACFRSNMLLLGVPLVQQLVPDADAAEFSLVITITVMLFNVLAILVLAYFSGRSVSPGQLLWDILKNPLILASLLGVLASLCSLRLPQFLENAVSQLGSAASPIALVLLGAQFEVGQISASRRDLILIACTRLLLYPAAALTVAAALGFRGGEFAVLIPAFCSPTAINSFNMACQMGGDPDLAAGAVTTTTLLSAFTMFFWIFLFKSLGLF